MSLISYNNVTLPYAFLTRFDQAAIYDESGTDWIGTTFDIMVQSVVNADYLRQLAPQLLDFTTNNPATDNPAEVLNALYTRLMRPRRDLALSFNGVDLIPQPTYQSGTVDSKNGPFPQSCTFHMMTNTTFLMTYHIKAQYWANFTTNIGRDPMTRNDLRGSNVLYNRWTETVDIDSTNLTTRTRDGKYAIRTDNSKGWTADQFREDFAMLGVPSGFLRKSSRYTVSPDGTAISYNVIDQQQYKMPPQGAYEARGEYIESTSRAGGYLRYGEAHVHLKGSPESSITNIDSQSRLLELAIAVAASKMALQGASLAGQANVGDNSRTILEAASFMTNMYDNEVDVRIRCMLKPRMARGENKARVQGIPGMSRNRFTFTPLSDGVPPTPPAYPTRGTAPILLQAAAYYDPSLVNAGINPVTGQMKTGLEIGQAGKSVES